MGDDYSKEKDKSLFNMGLATLQRIHMFMQQANYANFIGDNLNFFKAICIYFNDVSPYLSPDDVKSFVERINNLKKSESRYRIKLSARNPISRNFIDTFRKDLEQLDRDIKQKMMDEGVLTAIREDEGL